jgi:hypothetical protein
MIPAETRQELTYIVTWLLDVDVGQGGDGEAFLNWLLGHYKTTPPQLNTPWEHRLEPYLWPDVCYICGADFGLTPAGRVRTGCPACRGEGPSAERLFGWRRWTGSDLDCPAFYRVALKYRRGHHAYVK